MFNPVLRKVTERRLVYSTSIGFRIVFAAIAIFSIVSMRQPNVVVIIFLALSLFGALYLERWVFDKDANVFEKNVGLLFLHTRKKLPLDRLQRVVLREVGPAHHQRPRMVRAVSRAAAILSVVDHDGRSYGLDMVKGASLREIRDSAAKLAEFCDIPFEDQGPVQEGEAAPQEVASESVESPRFPDSAEPPPSTEPPPAVEPPAAADPSSAADPRHGADPSSGADPPSAANPPHGADPPSGSDPPAPADPPPKEDPRQPC